MEGITQEYLSHTVNHTCHRDFENCKFLHTGVTKDPRGVGEEDEGGAGGSRTSGQFRVRNDLVQCDVDTVRYSLFNFGVNKFISGVNMYNLGVKVLPRCEPSNTC